MVSTRTRATTGVRRIRVPLLLSAILAAACGSDGGTASPPGTTLLAEVRRVGGGPAVIGGASMCEDCPPPASLAICVAYDFQHFFETPGAQTPPVVAADLTMGCEIGYTPGDGLLVDFKVGDPGFAEVVARLTNGVDEFIYGPVIPLDAEGRTTAPSGLLIWAGRESGELGTEGDLAGSTIELIRLRVDSLRLSQNLLGPGAFQGQYLNEWIAPVIWEFWGR